MHICQGLLLAISVLNTVYNIATAKSHSDALGKTIAGIIVPLLLVTAFGWPSFR